LRTVNGSRRKARDLIHEQLSGHARPSDCLAPIEIRYRGVSDRIMVGLGREADTVGIAYMHARCRQCENCLKARRRLWTLRAQSECALAPRTWFGTLTVRPMDRVRYLYAAQLRNDRASSDSWDTQSSADQFRKLVQEINPEITRFLKRVRKNAASFRYLLVTEAHEDGFPHFHMLVHELGTNILKKELDACWRVGFSRFKLIPVGDPKGARYVCKYLSKSALTRIRGSQRYGQIQPYGNYIADKVDTLSHAIHCLNESEGTEPSK